MPLPDSLARFNRRVTNPLAARLAGRLPGFGIVVHRGRVTGRTYRTPVNLFGQGSGYVVALTYGPDRDWVRNVLAEGGCELETRGRVVRATSPRLVHDRRRREVPGFVRPVLGLLGVDRFLELSRTAA
jgi:deazaflavin-dependent oxidoreductase (nitroreductase family)